MLKWLAKLIKKEEAVKLDEHLCNDIQIKFSRPESHKLRYIHQYPDHAEQMFYQDYASDVNEDDRRQ